MASRPRLLVTRPLAAAQRFGAAAEAAGFAVAIEPMLTIRPAPDAAAGLAGAQAVLLTSAAAVAPLAAALVRRDLPVLTVGDATAAAAAAAGFLNVASADGDAADLEMLAADRLDPAAGPIVHAGGERRAGDLAGGLAGRGFDARTAVLYHAVPTGRLQRATAAALAAGRFAYAAFFSPQTARTFASLARAAEIADSLGGTTAVALSRNVGDGLGGLNWRQVLTADRPTAAALLAKLVASAFGATPDDGTGEAE